MTFNVPVQELAAFLKKDVAARSAKALRAVQLTVALQGPRIAQRLVSNTKPMPVDRGTYRRSFHAEDLPNGAVFYNSAPHAGVMEYGRRPGTFPPVKALTEWVRRKRIERDPKKAAGIAFAIALKMKREGWPGAGRTAPRIVERTGKELLPLVMTAVRDALTGPI